MLDKKCDRCKSESFIFKMSFFNEDMLCRICVKKEELHPKYDEAKRVETAHVRAGNFNFKGIGLPKDLRPE